MNEAGQLVVNGRRYLWPQRPVVVVCLDGCQPEYLTSALAAGCMPYSAELKSRGFWRTALAVMPTYTNPNNISIITGVPPRVHGICGNYFFDTDKHIEVMMNEPEYLQAETIPAVFARAGAKVAIVTAKDKLRRMLGHGLDFSSGRCTAFSAEYADRASREEHGVDGVPAWLGRPQPNVYSAAISEFVLAAGVKLLQEYRPDLIYLSTTDYIQHKYGPETQEAMDFYRMLDGYFAQLDALGADLVITADHGMMDKHDQAGNPNVVYLQDLLDDWLGRGKSRVVLPITDPYVVHHGSLGSFATVYLAGEVDRSALIAQIRSVQGMEDVLTGEEACQRFDLPQDRVGQVVVVAASAWTIGTSLSRHDLSGLKEPLRSHGGYSEQRVPMIANAPVADDGSQPHNYDAFHIALNLISR